MVSLCVCVCVDVRGTTRPTLQISLLTFWSCVSVCQPQECQCADLFFCRDAARIWVAKVSNPDCYAKPWLCIWCNLLFCSWHRLQCIRFMTQRVHWCFVLTEINMWSTLFKRFFLVCHQNLLWCFLNSVSSCMRQSDSLQCDAAITNRYTRGSKCSNTER